MDEEKAKKVLKKIKLISIISSLGFTPIIFIAILIAILVVLGIISGAGGSNNGTIVYESECNYEKTMVTVMDGSNTKVLATISLEDYIIGVACVEIGACNGASSSIAEHYVKSQYVASKTYVLTRGQYNSNTKSITIKASTRDQQWCDLNKGCIITKESDTIYHNSYPGDYTTSQINGEIIGSHKFTEEDLTAFHQYYQDTYGELFLPETYQDVITTFDSTASIAYKSSTQLYWRDQAVAGHEYEEILKSTATAGVADSEKYKDKTIYELGRYCKSTNTGSSGRDEAIGDVTYLDGGLPIPIYYQQDYADVTLERDKTVSSSGCGFTSTSMIVSYLTDKKITPRELVDDWSRQYYIYNQGMSWGLPNAAASHYGLDSVEATTDSNRMVQALKEGRAIMSSQGPGLFTSGGHLIVLRGITSDGKILVNDPNRNNAVNKNYNEREFTVSEINRSNRQYFIWPKKK